MTSPPRLRSEVDVLRYTLKQPSTKSVVWFAVRGAADVCASVASRFCLRSRFLRSPFPNLAFANLDALPRHELLNAAPDRFAFRDAVSSLELLQGLAEFFGQPETIETFHHDKYIHIYIRVSRPKCFRGSLAHEGTTELLDPGGPPRRPPALLNGRGSPRKFFRYAGESPRFTHDASDERPSWRERPSSWLVDVFAQRAPFRATTSA